MSMICDFILVELPPANQQPQIPPEDSNAEAWDPAYQQLWTA